MYNKCKYLIQLSANLEIHQNSERERERERKREKGKVHPCTGTEALYRLYGPKGE